MGKKARKKKKKETKKKQRVIKSETTDKPGIEFSIDDSVVVKKGTLDPDYGNDISGWQGRIYEIDDNFDNPLIRIEWDSMTLRNMPRSVIEDSEKDGLVWSKMDLYASDLEPSKHRDSEEKVAEILEMISKKYDLEEFDDGDTGLIEDEIEMDQTDEKDSDHFKSN